jgi:uncharacterized protein (TIGR02996 family)
VTDLESFLTALEAEPTDDTLWLVFADWLEERGDSTSSEVRKLVEAGGWARFRKGLLGTFPDDRAQRIGWECRSRLLPMYEALCPQDTAPRVFIETMIRGMSGKEAMAASVAFHESARLRGREFMSDPSRDSELAFDVIVTIRALTRQINEVCTNCAELALRAEPGIVWSRLSTRGQFLRNAEIRWQVARILRHRFEQEGEQS